MVQLDEEGLFMKSDDNNNAVPDTPSTGDQQNRREFLNGLGKWSMIVIAGVSLLRRSASQVHAGLEIAQRPEWEPPETGFIRLAKKKHRQHVDIPPGHQNVPHTDVAHVDYKIQMQ